MTRIARTAHVHIPYGQAIDSVVVFFAERPQLTVRGVASSTADVDVRYDLLYDWTRLLQRYDGLAFAWRPRWHGFPSFGATLSVQPATEGALFVLEGSYNPPGGGFGRLFDRVIGEKLAARTMDHLLRELTRYVEQRYAKTPRSALTTPT